MSHWEDDYTFVVETTGLDENTWLNGAGYPHTVQAHVQERYTRVDHNDLQLTVTVDDPTLYTKPFVLGKLGFKWWPSQQLAEQLCLPSEMIQYLSLIRRSGRQGRGPGEVGNLSGSGRREEQVVTCFTFARRKCHARIELASA